jgi:hypothetical protein
VTSCVLEEVINDDASSLENTWFLLFVPSWKHSWEITHVLFL